MKYGARSKGVYKGFKASGLKLDKKFVSHNLKHTMRKAWGNDNVKFRNLSDGTTRIYIREEARIRN